MKKDAPMYLAASKKHFDRQMRVPLDRKHILEQKMTIERRDSTQYAARNGEAAPSFVFPQHSSNPLKSAETASLNRELANLVCDRALLACEAMAD